MSICPLAVQIRLSLQRPQLQGTHQDADDRKTGNATVVELALVVTGS